MDLRGNVGGARLGNDIENGVELRAAIERDHAARYCESLTQYIDAAFDLLQRSADRRRRAGASYRQLAAPLAVEPMTTDKDVAGHVDRDVERGWERRLLVRSGGGWRWFSGLAVCFNDFQHDDIGRQALRKVDFRTIDRQRGRDLWRGQGSGDRYLTARRCHCFVARGHPEIVKRRGKLGGRPCRAAQCYITLRL